MPRALGLSTAKRLAFGGVVGELAAALGPNMPPARQAHAESQVIGLMADVLLDTSSHLIGGGSLSAQRLNDLEDWIEAHLGEPITLGRLCSVVGVGERSLQLAFSARRGMSPMRFVTEQRLQAAHRRLAASGGIPDVTSVAIELGFTHMGRFSMTYREAFGELPSRTRLRRQHKAR
jgi:transcriptional regulator GlxA family with amidase domain